MQAVQAQAPLAFNYRSTVPPARTLNDLRMGQNNYNNASNATAKAMRPLLIVALLIAVGVGIVWSLSKSSENSAAKVNAATTGPAPTVAAASSLPVTRNDSAVSTPLMPLTKSQEVTPVLSAAPTNTRSSESVKPVKVKSLVALKAARVAAKEIAPIPASPVNELAAPQPQATPPPTPTAIAMEEKPVAPPAEPPAEQLAQ
jgi:hypothetical protein